MSKFIKSLIIINGLIIPIALIVLFIFFIIQIIQDSADRYVPEVVNTDNVITKGGDTLLIQGLRYENPRPVYNSTNFIIEVMPKTYDIPRKLDSNPINYEGGSRYSSIEFPSQYYVNILFLDAQYNVVSKLVDKKASIESVSIPHGNDDEKIDTTVKNIGYLIAFEDSNKDKKIDWKDKYDLFISNLEGKDLIQVTREIDVTQFNFINKHKDIFISYTDRTDIRDEYKITKFAIYSIDKKQLRVLSSIDKSLLEVEKILQ